MTKRELALLEKAFAAEISAAVNGGIRVIQTRGKLADKMVADGMISKASVRLGGWLSAVISNVKIGRHGDPRRSRPTMAADRWPRLSPAWRRP